jgi:hypothetical protein
VTQVWLVRCGGGGRYVEDAIAQGVITIDFHEASDVTGLSVNEIAVQLSSATTRTAFNALAKMVYAFANEISLGDLIVTSDRARRQVAIGRVTGPYVWIEDTPIPDQHHMRRVDWIATRSWDDLTGSTANAILHSQGTVLLLPDQEEALALIENSLSGSGSAAPPRVAGIHEWWTADPRERYWMEITDRPDLGANLHAPQRDDAGSEYWSYALVTSVRPGDVVLHWWKLPGEDPALVGWSRAVGEVRAAEIVWTAHGSYGRARPSDSPEPSWLAPLENFTEFDSAVTLGELRAQEMSLRAVRDALELRYGKPLYFPFVFSDKRPLRTAQGYLVKFPAALVEAVDSLAWLHTTDDQPGGATPGVASRRSSGAGYMQDPVVRKASSATRSIGR